MPRGYCKDKTRRGFQEGYTPWNKGIKGLHLSPNTEFKKWYIPWNKEKECIQFSGKNNPTLSMMKEFFFTAQSLAKYLHVPGAQKPSKIKILQGVEETYIAPLNTLNELIDELQ